MSPIRVAVCSPQPIVFAGITTLLAKHSDRVQIVPAPGRPEHLDPDVVIYDVLALLDGDTGPLRYLIEMTSSRVLAVGRGLGPDLVGDALATGVDGFFSLGVDESGLLAAVESATAGWEDDDPSTSQARAHQLGADVGLTDREVEVLTLVASGCSNEQIATDLFLSISSIKAHIRSAYRKTGVASRAGAMAWAIRHGFASERV
jgi:two-component system, NarL family, response regulator LiaR